MYFFILNFKGDSGYTQSPYILTPINNSVPGTPEFAYSQVIRRTRCRVEQLFGIWKEVVRCLNSDRILHYDPHFAAEIVRASAVFYNFLRHHGYVYVIIDLFFLYNKHYTYFNLYFRMPMPVPPQVIQREDHFIFDDDDYELGLEIRRNIIQRYFGNQNRNRGL